MRNWAIFLGLFLLLFQLLSIASFVETEIFFLDEAILKNYAFLFSCSCMINPNLQYYKEKSRCYFMNYYSTVWEYLLQNAFRGKILLDNRLLKTFQRTKKRVTSRREERLSWNKKFSNEAHLWNEVKYQAWKCVQVSTISRSV